MFYSGRMDDLPLTRAEGFPCQGQLLSGESVAGLLILRYARQEIRISGFPYQVGAGMTRWCDLKIDGTIPQHPGPFTAVVVSDRLGERMQIDVTPEIVVPGEGFWSCQGAYELKQRWKLPGAGLGIQEGP